MSPQIRFAVVLFSFGILASTAKETRADLPQGYCTIMGCDHDTCPDESVCVRFFAVAETGKTCDPGTEETTPSCDPEEFCTLSGSCVPRTAEIRFCMRTCGNDGDCRDGYECRDRQRMIEHGGEPVFPPDIDRLAGNLRSFCAAAPR